jgi:hypothetical protein
MRLFRISTPAVSALPVTLVKIELSSTKWSGWRTLRHGPWFRLRLVMVDAPKVGRNATKV